MEINEKRKNKDVVFVVIILLLVVVLVGLIGFAYARYITIRNGQAQAPIASWNFNVTAGSRQDLVIDLATTRNANDTDQVDRSTVAPGTSGVLQLNVNASGTETSLEYNINLNLSEVPPNLIFYYDQNMQNAIYKENNVINLTGFFDANNSNKTVTRNLYWKWPLETGSTTTEINNNDELDSEYMGQEITMAVVATGTQVMQSTATANQGVQVTFDANGGTIQGYGNSSQMTKSVVPGEQYGSLPVPTRPGYRFLGWNGKNKFDKTKYLKLEDYPDKIENSIYYGAKIHLKARTTYKVSIIRNNGYDGTGNKYLLISNNPQINDSSWSAVAHNTEPNHSPSNYIYTTTGSGMLYIGYIEYETQADLDTIWANTDIQIEEGNTATAYESYYISSTTNITQNANHTLTAIWEEI